MVPRSVFSRVDGLSIQALRRLAVTTVAAIGAVGSEMSFIEHLEELRRRILWSLVAVSAAFGVCWIFAGDRGVTRAAPQTDTVEADVRALYQKLLLAWNRRDAAAMAACFADDGSMVGFDRSAVDTRAEVEAHLAPIFADHPTATFVARVREVRMPGAKVARLRAVAGMLPPGGEDVNPAVNTIQSLVAVSQADEWYVALFQNTPAAWHGRPDDSARLTEELRAAVRSGVAVE